jgi:hypothetical protein
LAAASPPGLLTFSEEEWAAPGDAESWQAFQRWTEARRAWVKAHPDSSLGSMLDVLRGNRKGREELMGWKVS